ncbi:hypothetical protein Tco_0983090 [Tanacetum coccineum]
MSIMDFLSLSLLAALPWELCIQDQGGSVQKLLHKDFSDFSSDGECLIAGRFLDNIDDNLKSFFLLWNSSLQAYIGGTYLDSFISGNPLFITSSDLTDFFLIS